MELVKSRGCLFEEDYYYEIKSLLNCINCSLHDNECCHSDLKPENSVLL